MGLDESMSDTPESHNGGFSQQPGSCENVFEKPSFYFISVLKNVSITCPSIVCPNKRGQMVDGRAKSNQWVSLVPPDLAEALSLSERNLGQERHLVSRGDTDSLQLSMVQSGAKWTERENRKQTIDVQVI